MTPQIRRHIHALRNAFVLATETRSHECFRMGRFQELNELPHSCCDLAIRAVPAGQRPENKANDSVPDDHSSIPLGREVDD